MADAASGQLQEPGRGPQGRDGVGSTGEKAISESCRTGLSQSQREEFSGPGGQMKGEQLPNFIEHSFLPDQPTEKVGETSSQSAPTSRRQRIRRQWVSRLSDESLQRLAALQKGGVPDGSERNSLAYSLCLELAANSTKKRLNVSFVEWLQGLPEGHTTI